LQPIRILQVVTQMNRAGLESRLMDIYRNIDRDVIQFDFFTFNKEKGYFDDEILSLGGIVYYSDSISAFNMFQIANKLQKFFLGHLNYKIVHCHMNQWCGIILRGAKKADIQIRIAHSRTAITKLTIKNFVKNLIKLNVNKYATHRFAVSNEAGEWLFGKRYVKNEKVKIWPNAINMSAFKYNEENRKVYRKSFGIDNFFVLIHVGNIRPEKNHRFLIDLLGLITEGERNPILLVVGEDYMNGQLQKYVKKKSLTDRVLFLGNRTDVPELLHASDMFLFPSFYEGFPGAVLESQAAGLTTIISESVTSEVCITKLVRKYPLKDIAGWKDAIESSNTVNRVQFMKSLKESMYDINKLTIRMQEFYKTVHSRIEPRWHL